MVFQMLCLQLCRSDGWHCVTNIFSRTFIKNSWHPWRVNDHFILFNAQHILFKSQRRTDSTLIITSNKCPSSTVCLSYPLLTVVYPTCCGSDLNTVAFPELFCVVKNFKCSSGRSFEEQGLLLKYVFQSINYLAY